MCLILCKLVSLCVSACVCMWVFVCVCVRVCVCVCMCLCVCGNYPFGHVSSPVCLNYVNLLFLCGAPVKSWPHAGILRNNLPMHRIYPSHVWLPKRIVTTYGTVAPLLH